ncbi:ATXN7 family protein [Megaselia abdita]
MLSSIFAAKGSNWNNLFEDSDSPASPGMDKMQQKKIYNLAQHSTPFSQNGNVMTLPKSDSFLYGEFPEIESFSLCICYICGLTIKPQGLLRHMAIRHGRRNQSDNKINGSRIIMNSQTYKSIKNIKLKIPTIESSSSSTTSSSTVNSPQKTDESSNEVELILTNVLTPTTVPNTFIAPAPPVEIEPSMSPLSEILQQIQDGSNELPEITDCSLSSEHFKEVQKLIKSFEDVERSQGKSNDETLTNAEKQIQIKFLTDHLSNQERFESNENQAFNLLYNRLTTKQSKLGLLTGSDYLVFMFIETDDQFQDLVFDRVGVCDAIKTVTDHTLAADFPQPRPPDHEKTFKEVYQDLINSRHLLMDKFVPSSFLDVHSLSAVLPRPYKNNISREIGKSEDSCALSLFIKTSFDILLKDNDSLDTLQELSMDLVTNWKFSHITSFQANYNWSFDTVENLLSACLDSKLWKYVSNTEDVKNLQRSTLILNTISLLRFAELWSFLKQNYYQHLEQYQYYRFQLGNVDANVINEIKMIFPLLERRCIDLQIYIRESAIRIAYILNLQLFILTSEQKVKPEARQNNQLLTQPFPNELKFFLPFQNIMSKQTGHSMMVDNMWLNAYNSFCETKSEDARTLLARNAYNVDKKMLLTQSSMAMVQQNYKRVSKKISTKYPKNIKCFQSALFLHNFLTNDLFLKMLRKEKVDVNIFVNSILPKGVDFVRKNKCGGTTIYCLMMDSDMISEQNEKERCFYNRFLVSSYSYKKYITNNFIYS